MTIEELEVLITANTEELRRELKSSQKELLKMQRQANTSASKMLKSFNFLKNGIIALGIGKIIGSQMDDAVSRLDALNNFPRVMSNLGIGSKDAEVSMQKLSSALEGLPTTLDDATLSVQRFTSANGNVKASTEMFLALNNAILAGGASTEIQKSALEQLSQAYAKGKPDMMEWRTAMSAMPAQLKQVAIAMGYANANQLGEALRGGTISMDEFMIKLVELNKNGANGFKSLEEQARNSTGGVATSIINVKTALTRGLADIMNAIGQSNIAGFFQGIARAINKVTTYIVGFVKAIIWAINSLSALFGRKTKKSIDDTTESLGDLGTGGVSAAEDLDDTTDSAGKLKKALNGLAGFDEMNVLTENSGSSSGADASAKAIAGIGDIDLSGFDDLEDRLSGADTVALKLQEIFEKIGRIFKSIWLSDPVQAFVDLVRAKFNFIKDLSVQLGTDLWTNMTTTWSNIKDNVSDTLINISELFTNVWTDMRLSIEEWGPQIIEGISGVFNSIWKDAIDPYLVTITDKWKDFTEILVEEWDKHGSKITDGIGEMVNNAIKLFQKFWDDILKPIIQPFLEMFEWLWDKHLKKVVKEVADFVGELIVDALEIYNKFIYPVYSMIMDKLAPVWSVLSSTIINVLGSVVAFIVDVVGSIIRTLKGIIEFITGVMTGNWRKAWQGIVDIFGGIWDSLVALVRLPINLIIDKLNSFFASINQIKIPSWVPGIGGKGFYIKPIPKLARGGVVDRPTTVQVGEAGKEAIMPLENNTGWIDELADKLNSRGDGQPYQIIVKVGEDTLLDKVVDGINQKSFERNGEVFNL